jgi:hypothetical protein
MIHTSTFDEAMSCPFINETQKTKRWTMNAISSNSAHSISSLFGDNDCSDADLELLPCFSPSNHVPVAITKDDTSLSVIPRGDNLTRNYIEAKIDDLIIHPMPYINHGMSLRKATDIVDTTISSWISRFKLEKHVATPET